MSRITRQPEERRQEIVDTALELFMENGFAHTQVADITKRMNASQGLVYHYFKSKTDILYAVIDQIAAEHTKQASEMLAKHPGSTLDRLTLLFTMQPDYERYGQLIPSLTSDQATIEYCVQTMSAASLPLLISIIEAGNADGSLHCDYPEETAVFVLHGLGGLVKVSDQRKPDGRKTAAMRDLVLHTLGAVSSPPI